MATNIKRAAEDSFFLVSPKFLKLDESLRKDLENVHAELSTLEKDCREEQIEVQCKYDAMKTKHFDTRAELVKKIPHFWKEVLLNFGTPAGLIHPDEVEVLDHLVDVKLEDNLDKKGSHKFTFTFNENPFFKETTIVKQVKVHDEDTAIVDVTPITFTKNPIEGLDEEVRRNTFLGWLQSKEEDGEDDFGTTFREHVWEEVIKVYQNEHDDEDDDEDDDDDDDDEEGEEGGEGEGEKE